MDRRMFVKSLIGSSVLSVAAINRLNAAVYRNIESLNQDFPQYASPDGAYWDGIAEHFIFEDGLIMMNNGTVGPMPKTVFNTLVKTFKIQSTNPYDYYNFLPGLKQGIRDKLAAFINASEDEVAINRNTTEGMNLVANGIDFEEGDEVIISSLEHPAGYHPWKLQEKRHKIKVIEVPIQVPPKSVGDIIEPFRRAITPRTRVVSVSHTVYITGLIFPLKELSAITREKGILLLADSAHGLGMLDLDMKELGIDVFCSSPYKWCGAPTGCGLLYVRKEAQDRIWPQIASSGWDTNKNARRFETLGQRADALVFGLGEALDFQNAIGRGRIERRIKTLASYLKQQLQSIPKVRLHTPSDTYISGGLTALSVEGLEPGVIVDYLREKYNLVIRTIGREKDNTRGVRVSTNIFISQKHVDMLLEGIDHLARKKS